MNILFLSTENPYPPDSGHLIRTFNILAHIARQHDVYFIGFIKKREDIAHVGPIREICRSADVFTIPDDLSRFRLYASLFSNLFSTRPYIVNKYYRKDVRDRIREIVRDNGIDVVHFDMLHMAGYRKDIEGLPSVLTEHNVESLRVGRLAANSRNRLVKLYMTLQSMKLRRFEKDECSKYDMCSAVSGYDMRMLKAMSPGAELVVVPNGVDTAYFKPVNGRAPGNNLLWVGGMNDMYNSEAVDFFLEEIFPLIKKQVPDVGFTAVGKSPTRRLRAMAGRDRNIVPAGYVDDVRPHMEAASVYVAPIISGSGTKLKVLNALSMAKAVVTTSVGAEGFEVKDGEHIVIADDPELFASRTVELLRDPPRAARIGGNGRRLVCEKYDWQTIGGRMNEVYSEIAGRKKSQAASPEVPQPHW